MRHLDEEWYGDGNRYIFPALAESLYIEAQADHASDCSRSDVSRFLDVRTLVIVESNKDDAADCMHAASNADSSKSQRVARPRRRVRQGP